MSLKNLSNEELVSQTHKAVQRERDSLKIVIDHFVEISRRSLHLAAGYPSLYVYLMEVYQYSDSAAYRRVQAVRQCIDLPEIQESIQSGALNLSQISELATAVRQTQRKVSKDEKRELLGKIAGKSAKDSQVILAQELDIELKPAEKRKFQKDESVNIQVTFSKSQWEKIQNCRELLAASLQQNRKSTDFNDVVETMAEFVIRVKTKLPKSQTSADHASAAERFNLYS